ncbi:acyltransferase family protein [Alteromonas stellipolaris]|uniref:acyltransferase family protein n=1 Tax=Alteromonas stellipolaris TaxID=233316 RepID=UPI002737003C|nr:acyltransferase [Alteromonas stellipolaris]MDP2537244.1 acyltransferase [Alteromonas stellipolaris]
MRDIKVDTLRGLACIFLVAYHVIGNEPSNGLKVSAGLLREINDLLECVRMPLFTFLSGMVYAIRPIRGNWQSFMKGKARRLLVPMLVVGTLFALVQSVVPETNNNIENWWLLHIYPVQHFWFVEALFLVFLLIVPLEIFKVLESKLAVLTVIAFFLILSVGQPYPKIFAIKGFVYLMPFFLFGLFAVRFELKTLWPMVSIALFLALMTTLYVLDTQLRGQSLIGCLVGLASCYLLLGSKLSVPVLAKIGIYSYSIYIFHVFFTAATRILITNNFSAGNVTGLTLGLISGILGPIIIFLILKNYKYLRFLFLGQKI